MKPKSLPTPFMYQQKPFDLSSRFFITVLFVSLLFLFNPFKAWSGTQGLPSAAFDRYIGPKDALVIVDAHGHTLYSKNGKQPLVPASTLKVLTALAALHYLRTDFHYKTELYLTPKHDLIIKGYGDPLFISEVIEKLAQELVPRITSTTKHVNDILLDDSYFQKPIKIPGRTLHHSDPYNAPNGALCANFNTIFFKRATQNNHYVSAESQTPLLPFAIPRIKAAGLNQGRIILTDKNDEMTLYCGHLLRYFLKKSGLQIEGRVRLGRVTKDAHLLFTYTSAFTIQQVISQLLEFSNNFIANQLTLTMGAKVSQPPGTIEKGVRAILAYAKDKLQVKQHLVIVEGSGLSIKNRVTAEIMIQILKAFASYYPLMHSVNNRYYKTGTLQGVQTRIGYFKTRKGQLIKFALLINTPHKQAAPIMKVLSREINRMYN